MFPWLSGVMMPLCAGVLWVLYKYHSRTKHRRFVDLKTQRGLYRSILLDSVHGQPETVMQIYKMYTEQHYQLKDVLFNQEQDIFVTEVVEQSRPLISLVLGTQFGYSAIRILSLLPSQGKLYAMEPDKNVAEMSEELILMSGFKNTQFQMFLYNPVGTLHAMIKHFALEKVDFVMMDYQPLHYLQNLQSMEVTGILHPGTLILANHIEDSTAKEFLNYIQCDQCYRILDSCKDLLKIEFVGKCLL